MLPDEAFAFQFAVAGEARDQVDLEADGFQMIEEAGVLLAAELVGHPWLDDDLPERYRGCVQLGVGPFRTGRTGSMDFSNEMSALSA